MTRSARMEAAQAAALDLLRERDTELAARAEVIWEERYQSSMLRNHSREAPTGIAVALERSTFFSELRNNEHAELRARIWPTTPPVAADTAAFRKQFREQELRAQLLATAARLGHAFIDLYAVAMTGRSTLAARGNDDADDGTDAREGGERLIESYLALLEGQRTSAGEWGAFAELSELATNFELILDVNAPDARTAPLQESARYFAGLLRQQQPVAGMSGQVNQTLVRQFRMPGYPFVLVTTDLLQEGEDLHTFCSSVYHYGISWTPSSMEQRIGRIDRVRSQTDRRLSSLDREPMGDELLQVHFPFLGDTVEVLQVERVLRRMDAFLRLMHEGLAPPAREENKIDVQRELVGIRRHIDNMRDPLKSAFPVPSWALTGSKTTLAVDASLAQGLQTRFESLAAVRLGSLSIDWALHPPKGTLLGTARLASGRVQPFMLLLRSDSGCVVVRCVSPIGRTEPSSDPDAIVARAARCQSRIGAILTREERTYDLTVEDDVLLGAPEHDAVRVSMLVERVVERADTIEREHFEDQRDAPLDAFDADLRKEASHVG